MCPELGFLEWFEDAASAEPGSSRSLPSLEEVDGSTTHLPVELLRIL
jgi:hypothetical protein